MEPRPSPESPGTRKRGERHRIDGPATSPYHLRGETQQMAVSNGTDPAALWQRHSEPKSSDSPQQPPPGIALEEGEVKLVSDWEWDGYLHVRSVVLGRHDQGQRSRLVNRIYREITQGQDNDAPLLASEIHAASNPEGTQDKDTATTPETLAA